MDGDAFEYHLIRNDMSEEEGSGYTVVRSVDGLKLMWQTLPRTKGFESIEVSGESFHMDDLQQPCFAPGSRLMLVPQPDNPRDPNAVAIFDLSGKLHCGYVPSGEAQRIGKLIAKQQIEACFSMWEVYRDGRRVSLRLLLIRKGTSLQY